MKYFNCGENHPFRSDFLCPPVAIVGNIVFALPVCWFVGWTTLTLVITFEPFEIEPLYLACRFLVTRASHTY